MVAIWDTGAVLYLVRHGRTELNAQRRLQGRLDPPLDSIGVRQASAVAARIRELTGDAGVGRVIASPLARAQQTAGHLGLDVETDERWIELDYGCYEGAPLTDVPAEVWRSWYGDPSFATDGGESFGGVVERVRAAVEELADEARDENVVVVTHVTPIKAAIAWSLGAGYESMFRCHLSHAALNIIGFGRFGPVLHRFNETVPIDDP